MSTTFAQLGLPEPLVASLTSRAITEPFPIQAAAIPDGLAGRDVCGKAPTGAGKTLAFGLPILARVERAGRNRPRALVLAPTRELAEQIKDELSPLAESIGRSVYAIYGGVGYGGQKQAMRRGVDVLVACPGRLEDLIEQGVVDLRDVDIVVVDEADRMADMGFLPAVRRILDQTDDARQTLLFSATLDGDIAVLSKRYQHEPRRHDAPSVETTAVDARHHFWAVDRSERVSHTSDVVEALGSTIVFTRTRRGADRLAKQLSRNGVAAVAMHGGRNQNQRKRALAEFTRGRVKALVATDVAARGIHVDDVAAVVHYDPAGDHKDYLHRSGRTARAGATGVVVSLVTGDQRRDTEKMLRSMDFRAPIESPRVAALETGGSRIDQSPADGRASAAVRTNRAVRGPATDAPSRSADREELHGGGRRGSGRARRPVDGRQSIYVANLPWSATSTDIEQLFGGFGPVHDATVVVNRKTGRSKGFGFVEMPVKAAEDAIGALHGSSMGGRDLQVRPARPRNS